MARRAPGGKRRINFDDNVKRVKTNSQGVRDNNVHNDDGDDDDIAVCIDLRDIPGQIEKEVEYMKQNANRAGNAEHEAFYAETTSGSKVASWGGKRSEGETRSYGILSTNFESGVFEGNMTMLGVTAGKTDTDSQKGIEAEVVGVDVNHKIGPVNINGSALGAGYDAGIGRNTGAFVRGNLASVGASVGPIGANVGVGFDTGARAGADGVEIQALGTGIMVDRNQGIGISLFGTSIKFKPW